MLASKEQMRHPACKERMLKQMLNGCLPSPSYHIFSQASASIAERNTSVGVAGQPVQASVLAVSLTNTIR